MLREPQGGAAGPDSPQDHLLRRVFAVAEDRVGMEILQRHVVVPFLAVICMRPVLASGCFCGSGVRAV